MQCESSPAWKNPRDVLKKYAQKKNLRRMNSNRKLCLDENPSTSLSQPAFSTTQEHSAKLPTTFGQSKRKNPFKISPRKKKNRVHDTPKRRSSRRNENFAPSPLPEDTTTSSNLCAALENQDLNGICSSADCPTDFSGLLEEQNVNFSPASHLNSTSTPCSSAKKVPVSVVKRNLESEKPPVDLRLAESVKISSSEPFPWMDFSDLRPNLQVKAGEKSWAAQLFSKEQIFADNSDLKLEGLRAADEKSILKSKLSAATMYWCHPNLPWLNMFPRIEESGKKKDGVVVSSVASLGKKISQTVLDEWKKSFESLYQSWKSGLCSHFYICCPTFTVLFVNVKSAEDSEDVNLAGETSNLSSSTIGSKKESLTAVISPTSVVLRQALKDEGIAFERPFQSASRRGSTESAGRLSVSSSRSSLSSGKNTSLTQSQPPFAFQSSSAKPLTESQSCMEFPSVSSPEKNRGEEGEGGQDEDGEHDSSGNSEDHEEWLKDIGISPATVEKMNRRTSAELSQRSSGSSPKDERLKSVAVISGTLDVHCLYNFLLNSQLCQAVGGPQAGLPPTLLSKTPFAGGALKNLQMKCWVQKREKQDQYVLEIFGGPVLPETVFSTCCLLQSGDMNRFSLSTVGRSFYAGMNGCVRWKSSLQDPLDCNDVQVGGLSSAVNVGSVFKSAICTDFQELNYEFGCYSV